MHIIIYIFFFETNFRFTRMILRRNIFRSYKKIFKSESDTRIARPACSCQSWSHSPKTKTAATGTFWVDISPWRKLKRRLTHFFFKLWSLITYIFQSRHYCFIQLNEICKPWEGGGGGGRGEVPNNGLFGEALPERGTCFQASGIWKGREICHFGW